MASVAVDAPALDLEVILAAHGEAESAGFFENFRVGHRTLAHSAEVMHLPAPLRFFICTMGALRKRLANRPGSPHNSWTRAQAAALRVELSARLGQSVSVRAAFASTNPSVESLLAGPSAVPRRIVLSMSPSDSRLSCGLLCHALLRRPADDPPTLVLARLWADPEFIALNEQHARKMLADWREEDQPIEASKTALLLVMHGTLIRDQHGQLPAFHNGDAEKTHFAHALQKSLSGHSQLPWSDVAVAYLNHDVAGVWSQPTVSEVLLDLHRCGVERLWVFPADFPVDGGEITGSLANLLSNGPISEIRLLPCLNDSPHFIDYLARRVQNALKQSQSSWQCDACPRKVCRASTAKIAQAPEIGTSGAKSKLS